MTAYDTGNSSFDPLRGLKESLNALRVRHFFSTAQLAEETGLSITEIESVFKRGGQSSRTCSNDRTFSRRRT